MAAHPAALKRTSLRVRKKGTRHKGNKVQGRQWANAHREAVFIIELSHYS
jgi:hypothetical protein